MIYDIEMKKVTPQILNYGFLKVPSELGNEGIQWYKIVIPQNFRGKYTLYICEGDIYGTFQGMAIQDHEFDSLMDKLAFRSPEAVRWVINLLNDLRLKGVIDFEGELRLPPKEGGE